MRVAVILPCRGRAEQTVETVRRLIWAAGYDAWELWLVGVARDVQPLAGLSSDPRVRILAAPGERLTYWQALDAATRQSESDLLCGLANDLLPGMHWLGRGVTAYQEAFPGEHDYGLLGFNGDSHFAGHSCHFLIDRDLLTYLGGWPVWYDHNFGDTELCQRAIALGFYAKAPWAMLYHNHPYFGAQNHDVVYAEGRAQERRDQALYEQRRAAGWPTAVAHG